MKNTHLTLILCFLLPGIHSAQSSKLRWIELQKDGSVSIEGNLSDGIDMPDLSWAWNSAVACFPATQASKFTGHHVLYGLDLPAYTELEISVIPADKSADFSLYAYQVGSIQDNNIVPNLSQCIRCEADHKWDYKMKGKVQDHTRHVRNILAINNPYQVVIGVVGSNGVKEGAFTLRINRKM